MNEPTVTVVVPAYKRLAYLREALASGLRQSYQDFELILSDDGASDEIAAFAASLGDPRVRYRRNDRNLGIAMNNFVAFSEARGKYIASLHDDDIWEPEFLETMVSALEADDDISVAFCDHNLVDTEGNFLPAETERNSRFHIRHRLRPGRHQPFLEAAVIDQAIPMVMAAVFRKSILGGAEYSRRLGGSYDHWLAYLAVKDGQACYYCPQRLTRYRVHEESGSKTRGVRNLRDSIFVRRKLLGEPALAGYGQSIRNGLGVFYGKMALSYLSRRSYWRGWILLKEAFSLLNRPKNIVALAANTILALSGVKQYR